MELNIFQRIYDHITFSMSLMVTGIGVMTVSEKIAVAGLLLGALSGLRAWIHRARLEKAQRRRNELIAQILAQSESRPLNASEKQALKQLEDQDDAPPH
ncbi:TPA: phage tail protein [Escherichia coli]|uniref:hypothetical protein n=1 Tax=Escherichia coli TaxID=562 RepID=UPI00053A281E|nr:hypothetical protein [Escherichia coli]HBC2946747.1 phage tail protein [Escherichia coli O146]HDQ6573433.1 phage tail protein [Escherichia coli O128:H2]HDQ6609957.1 phage tail protein [Escherichia coli Ou:H21]HDQ6879478.1 phage tail protein [Escherichia coli O174:H8]HDQ6951078.1 phage tail protein [Escherichia coli Ou:H8]